MKCTKYDELCWPGTMFYSRDHTCKILNVTRMVVRYSATSSYFSHCEIDLQCEDCSGYSRKKVELEASTLQKMQTITMSWK